MTGNIFSTLENAVKTLGKDRLLFNPILIDTSPGHRFLVGQTYRSLRDIITEVTKSPELSDSIFGAYLEYQEKSNKWVEKSNLDLGHISSDNNPNLTSPLEEQLHNIYLLYKESPELASLVQKSLEELYSIQAEFTYNFRNTTPENIKAARGILGESYVVLTLHTHNKNLDFAKKELAVYNKLLYKIATTIDILKVPGSNTILQDIESGLLKALGQYRDTKGHIKTSTKSSKSNSKAKTNVTTRKTVAPIRVRSTSGKFYSLVSLQSLLDRHLQDVISANMGNGSDRRILNYRTGRLAASAKVKRLSLSREGMITAFYSYMRNPYGTFSEGGKQQYPRTRDPKTLIGNSIREIAATTVGNRMRAVLV
jgi:hypothetical protein